MTGDHPRNTGPMLSSPRCGAKTRSGKPCMVSDVFDIAPLRPPAHYPEAPGINAGGCPKRWPPPFVGLFIRVEFASAPSVRSASSARVSENLPDGPIAD
jgi:hypothetical protein